MDQRPIGVFDSGLGGLCAVKELANIMPGEDIIYFGDTGRVPYGTRSRETITKYAFQDVEFLLSKNIKAVMVACGTVSSVALEAIKKRYDIKIIGVVKSACIAALKKSRNKRIGVLSTPATHKSLAFAKTLRVLDEELFVVSNPCPLFVPLVENGYIQPDNPVTTLVAEEYLKPLTESGVDTIILGCTHYPILLPLLSRLLGSETALIDSGKEAALHMCDYLNENGLTSGRSSGGRQTFYVSDTVNGFKSTADIFLGRSIQDIQKIEIEK